MPGVVFGATVIVPSGFIPTAPALGAGGVPGVSVTLVSITACALLAWSLATTLAVVPPAMGKLKASAPGLRSTTLTVVVACRHAGSVSAPDGGTQIW